MTLRDQFKRHANLSSSMAMVLRASGCHNEALERLALAEYWIEAAIKPSPSPKFEPITVCGQEVA